MKKIDQRTIILILFGIAIISVVVLSAALANLQMEPGESVPLESFVPNINQGTSGSGPMEALVTILRIIMVILWGLVPFYIIYLILSPEARKQFIKDALRLLPILILLWFFLANRSGQQVMQNLEMPFGQETIQESVPGEETEPLQFEANPSDWLVTLTSIGIAVGITALVVGIIFFVWRERQRQKSLLKPYENVAKEAQAAIDSIQSGGDLRDAIIRCYAEMGNIIRQNRNITRGQDMTPHEFEIFLDGRGLPREAIHNITVLFEKVRYGGITPGRQEEGEAISSLNAIINACRRHS